MEKRRHGGLGVLCLLLCAAAVAGAADAEQRHANPSLPPPSLPAPHFGFPLEPTLGSAAPPTAGAGGEGYPFIGSNPTVPLPTGMTDTATVLPLPDTKVDSSASLHCCSLCSSGRQVVGLAATLHVHLSIIGLGLVFAIAFLSTTCQLV